MILVKHRLIMSQTDFKILTRIEGILFDLFFEKKYFFQYHYEEFV